MDEKEKGEADRLSAVVLETLDEDPGTEGWARRAFRSRTQSYHLFKARVAENPASMRRRLLLERAAWRLGHTHEAVTAIAFEANYQPLHSAVKVFPWDTPDQSLREVLERIVLTKEVWAAALAGGEMPAFENRPPDERTPGALLARLEKADTRFHETLRDVRNRNAWGETFVDALCEPPETFTFGAMFAHIITFNAYRRVPALDILRKLVSR